MKHEEEEFQSILDQSNSMHRQTVQILKDISHSDAYVELKHMMKNPYKEEVLQNTPSSGSNKKNKRSTSSKLSNVSRPKSNFNGD